MKSELHQMPQMCVFNSANSEIYLDQEAFRFISHFVVLKVHSHSDLLHVYITFYFILFYFMLFYSSLFYFAYLRC